MIDTIHFLGHFLPTPLVLFLYIFLFIPTIFDSHSCLVALAFVLLHASFFNAKSLKVKNVAPLDVCVERKNTKHVPEHSTTYYIIILAFLYKLYIALFFVGNKDNFHTNIFIRF